MIPFFFPPQPEGGRQERRRKRRSTSSSESKHRRRRRRKERGRSRRRARSSTSPSERRGRKRSRGSPTEELPPARAGYAWVQVPLPGGQPPPPSLQSPPEKPQSEGWKKQEWQPASSWQGQQSAPAWQGQHSSPGWQGQHSSSSWQGQSQSSWYKGTRYQGGRSSQWQPKQSQRDKGWNKWQNPAASRTSHKETGKAAEHEADQGTAPPVPPQDEDQTRYNILEATPEEVEAQAARRAAQEEESYHKQLWDQAVRTAVQDPHRPKSAREMVREGKMRDWWSMSWKDCRALVDNDLQELYLRKLQELFEGHGSEGGAPDVLIQRLACLCAWWKQCGRPLEGEWGDLEFAILKVPGQRVACIRTRIEGPSYCSPRNARHCMVASHGMPHKMAMGLAELGEMCPGDTVDGEFPMYGFSARGTCAELTTENIRLSIAKVASKAKGMEQVIATFEGTLEQATPQTEGGMSYLSTACRDAGSSRAGDHLLLSPSYAVLRAISTPWPV